MRPRLELAVDDTLAVPDNCAGVPAIAGSWLARADLGADGRLRIEHSRTAAACGEPLGKETSWHTIEIPPDDLAVDVGLVFDPVDDQLQLICGYDVVDEGGEFPIPRGVVVLELLESERARGCARELAGNFGCPADFAFDVPIYP